MNTRWISHLVAGIAFFTLAPLVACGPALPPAEPPPSSDSTPVAVSAAPSASAAPTTSALVVAPLPGGLGVRAPYPIVPGTSCEGRGRVEDPGRPAFRQTGVVFSREERWGCGCPTRPVFTMVYEPKTSPLKVRLCFDPEADRCEALCTSNVSWNLEKAMNEAGASAVTFVE